MSRVAVLGTGLMGAPMARALAAAGHEVSVWNRSADKALALSPACRPCADPAEAVSGAALVVTMLTDGAAVDSLAGGTVPGAMAPGAIWVDMSSTRPAEARDHAARLRAEGLRHLDAPVSGGTKGAEAGTLAIMAGGAAETFAEAAPILSAMGRPVHVGPDGAGQLAKLANQAIVGLAIAAVAEAHLLLSAGGADPAAVRDALSGGFADSAILQQHGARMQDRDFAPGGPSEIQLKDLENVLGEAEALGLDLPSVRAVRDRYAALVRMGHGRLDHSALLLELESRQL